jgi:hypothetical protein
VVTLRAESIHQLLIVYNFQFSSKLQALPVVLISQANPNIAYYLAFCPSNKDMVAYKLMLGAVICDS